MKQEDIEKAAVDSCVFENSIFNPALTPYYQQGFKDGADWRIGSVWHDADDKPDESPQNKRLILIEHKADGDSPELSYSLIYSHTYAYFCVIRWAYIEDLIPDKED